MSLANKPREVERLARPLKKLACYYEAGPCGYALDETLPNGKIGAGPNHWKESAMSSVGRTRGQVVVEETVQGSE